jgi:hypothetical protein
MRRDSIEYWVNSTLAGCINELYTEQGGIVMLRLHLDAAPGAVCR